jgi:hypothetical protein
MKVSRVRTIEKTVTEDVSPEEIVDEIIDAIDFSEYCGIKDTDEFYEQMFEDGLEIVFNSEEELELSDEDISILKPLVIEKLKKIRKIKIDEELKTFLASPYYIAQLMEYLNEDLQSDFCFINSDTPEVREAIIKYLQKK